MSRWENQITNQENKKLRKYFVEHFLAQYSKDSSQIVLEIVVRGDAGFSLPEIIKICERSQVKYAFGFSSNAVLKRINMKAEWLEKGANPRFLVTNLEENAAEVYDNFYVQRGESSEGRIKELKRGIKANRLSCHQFIVNQFFLSINP